MESDGFCLTAIRWNREPPPGFQGLHPTKPLTGYRRHLPHWRQDGATYFVTFRLKDSLPQCVLQDLRTLRREGIARPTQDRRSKLEEERAQEIIRRTEAWLDRGIGSCLLKEAPAAGCVTTALHHFDGVRYVLGAFVVMPNRVHVIVRPLQPCTHPLERILQSWKGHSSRQVNAPSGLLTCQWQDESFDRIVRDEEHLFRCIQYIGGNPGKAGLDPDRCPRWLRPEWEQVGWHFEETLAQPASRGRTDLSSVRP